MQDDHNAPPFNPLSPVVWLLAAVIALPEIVFQLAEAGLIGGKTGIGWRVEAIETYGFHDTYWNWMQSGQVGLSEYKRLVTYVFMQNGLAQVLFGTVFALAFGKVMAEAMGGLATIVTFCAGALVESVAYGVLSNSDAWLLGSDPAVYALLGGFTWLLWMRGRQAGNGLGAFRLIAFLMGLQLLFQMISGGPPLWLAALAGFAAGFLVAPLLAPGARYRLARLLGQLRNR